MDLARQYSGFNNGYLCAAWELMRAVGWRSRETLDIAVAECEHYCIIERTRQGGRNRPNLYALTWWPIHARKDDPLDLRATTSPSNAWKDTRAIFELPDWIVAKRARDRQRKPKGVSSIELHAELSA
jgi:hypothetical protein